MTPLLCNFTVSSKHVLKRKFARTASALPKGNRVFSRVAKCHVSCCCVVETVGTSTQLLCTRAHRFMPSQPSPQRVLPSLLICTYQPTFGDYVSLIISECEIRKKSLTDFTLSPEIQQQQHYSRVRLHCCISAFIYLFHFICSKKRDTGYIYPECKTFTPAKGSCGVQS